MSLIYRTNEETELNKDDDPWMVTVSTFLVNSPETLAVHDAAMSCHVARRADKVRSEAAHAFIVYDTSEAVKCAVTSGTRPTSQFNVGDLV